MARPRVAVVLLGLLATILVASLLVEAVWRDEVGLGDVPAVSSGGDATPLVARNDPDMQPAAGEAQRSAVRSVDTEALAAARLCGRVFDVDTHEGVSGATVYLLPPTTPEGFELGTHMATLSSLPQDLNCETLGETITEAGGAFDLQLGASRLQRNFDLIVLANGYLRSGVIDLNVSDAESEEILIGLSRGWSVGGRVVDTSMRPLEGVRVLATTDYSARGREVRLARFVRRQDEIRPRLSSPFCYSAAETEPDGTFLLRGLFSGEYVMNVDADGWVMQGRPTVKAGEMDVMIVLMPAFQLRVDAVDAVSGAPLSRFAVNGIAPVGSDRLTVSLAGRDGVCAGYFTLSNADPRVVDCDIHVSADGYFSETKKVVLQQLSAVEVRFAMRPNLVRVPFSVRDSSQSDVHGVEITIVSPKGGPSKRVELETSSAGAPVAWLPAGRWIVRLKHPLQFPGRPSWEEVVSIASEKEPPTVVAELNTKNQLVVDLRGIANHEQIKWIYCRPPVGLAMQGLRPPGDDAAHGVWRWVGVPEGVWTLEVPTVGGRLIKSVSVSPGENWVAF